MLCTILENILNLIYFSSIFFQLFPLLFLKVHNLNCSQAFPRNYRLLLVEMLGSQLLSGFEYAKRRLHVSYLSSVALHKVNCENFLIYLAFKHNICLTDETHLLFDYLLGVHLVVLTYMHSLNIFFILTSINRL